jgi:hypothetical protein
MLQRAEEEHGARRPTKSISRGRYTLKSYRGRFFDEGDGYARRSVWIEIWYSRTLVGVADLTEWRLPTFPVPRDFWELADDISLEDSEFAEVVCSFWPDYEFPSDYGNLLNFVRLAIDTKRDRGRRALKMLGEFLDVEAKRRVSLMVLKAFPLEFESELPEEEVRRHEQFAHRLRAMLRVYERDLGAKPIPDQATYPGFMWKELRYCPEPQPLPSREWLDE